MCLNPSQIEKILDEIIKADEKFFAEMMEKHKQFASFCGSCRKNTAAGFYPFWHRKRRILCSYCGKEYSDFLKSIKAWEY